MSNWKTFSYALACLTLGSRVGFAQGTPDLQGFRLGSSFAEAKSNAEAKGWHLKPLSPNLPHQWIAEPGTFGLYVCADKVSAVQKDIAGGLDEFVVIVSDLRRTYGDPTTNIVSVMYGATRISNIDTRFNEKSGVRISVQLSSIGGTIGIHMNFAANIECPVDSITDKSP